MVFLVVNWRLILRRVDRPVDMIHIQLAFDPSMDFTVDEEDHLREVEDLEFLNEPRVLTGIEIVNGESPVFPIKEAMETLASAAKWSSEANETGTRDLGEFLKEIGFVKRSRLRHPQGTNRAVGLAVADQSEQRRRFRAIQRRNQRSSLQR